LLKKKKVETTVDWYQSYYYHNDCDKNVDY